MILSEEKKIIIKFLETDSKKKV